MVKNYSFRPDLSTRNTKTKKQITKQNTTRCVFITDGGSVSRKGATHISEERRRRRDRRKGRGPERMNFKRFSLDSTGVVGDNTIFLVSQFFTIGTHHYLHN